MVKHYQLRVRALFCNLSLLVPSTARNRFLQCPEGVYKKALLVALDDSKQIGEITASFSSKARMALALKVICNYPKPTQLAVFPKSAREMLQAVHAATGRITDTHNASWKLVRLPICS